MDYSFLEKIINHVQFKSTLSVLQEGWYVGVLSLSSEFFNS